MSNIQVDIEESMHAAVVVFMSSISHSVDKLIERHGVEAVRIALGLPGGDAMTIMHDLMEKAAHGALN